MPRLSEDDLRAVRDVSADLEVLVDGATPALQAMGPRLRDLLGTHTFCAYGLSQTETPDEGLAVTFSTSVGANGVRIERVFPRWVGAQPAGWGAYNPSRPEPKQRNVALTLRQLGITPLRPVPVVRDFFPAAGIAGWDQLRILLCDGPALLAWVGGFQPEPFTARQRRLLRRVSPALRRRLVLEQHLASSALRIAALDAALDAIGMPAFVVSASGSVRFANAAGKSLVDGDRRSVLAGLRDAVRTPRAATTDYRVTPLRACGAAAHFLVLRGGDAAVISRVASATSRWGLTPRQHEVLVLLARGLPNKTIAATLRCAERTVEQHVGAILMRAQVESRAQLVAQLWDG
jgi:DNA-binding CsgD family transcriptional regulator